jgi:hypothetical protein
MKKLLIILTLSLLALNTFGQRVVRGKVVDDLGEPAIGASVRIKDTNTGTVTDFDGNFILQVPNNDDLVLVISYIGLESREIKISSNGKFKVMSSSDAYRRTTFTRTIGVNYDIANSLFGVSYRNNISRGRSVNYRYEVSAQSNFEKDYGFAGSFGWQPNWWRLNTLSLNYEQKNLSENIDFNFQKISIKGNTSMRRLGRLFVEPAFQTLNDNNNFGLTLGLDKNFWLRNYWVNIVNVALSAGYFNDYWTYSAGANFYLPRNFGLRLIYDRIDSYDFFNVGLTYIF